MTSDFVAPAKEFAKMALSGKEGPTIVQNAHKAVVFALSAYAEAKGRKTPTDYWETENLARTIAPEVGRKFGTLLRMYLGSYRLRNGKNAKLAIEIMKAILTELGKLVGENFLDN